MSPPLADKARSSPTLFEMMASEPGYHPREAAGALMTGNQISNAALSNQNRNPEYREALMQQRLTDILSRENPGNEFNDSITGDVKLTLRAKDGIKISLYVHRKILVEHSRFFEEKLSKRWIKQQRNLMGPFTIEIADCDDIEVYIETLKLMYCQDIRKRLVKTEVPRVLGILKVMGCLSWVVLINDDIFLVYDLMSILYGDLFTQIVWMGMFYSIDSIIWTEFGHACAGFAICLSVSRLTKYT